MSALRSGPFGVFADFSSVSDQYGIEQAMSVNIRGFYCFVCLLLCSFNASASDMGNGPAAINTWVIGGCVALVLALSTSTKEDQETHRRVFRWPVFMTKLMAYSAIVFIAGIVAIFF